MEAPQTSGAQGQDEGTAGPKAPTAEVDPTGKKKITKKNRQQRCKRAFENMVARYKAKTIASRSLRERQVLHAARRRNEHDKVMARLRAERVHGKSLDDSEPSKLKPIARDKDGNVPWLVDVEHRKEDVKSENEEEKLGKIQVGV